MPGCGNCGGCSKCGGCRGGMELNSGELEFLEMLGEVAFAPVTRQDETPVYLGKGWLTREEYSLILQCLEKKGLVSLDYDLPLKGFSGYEGYDIRGSVALTTKGQQVLELLDLQGTN